MKVSDFEFDLPVELIAQVPASVRDAARLLVLDRHRPALVHATVSSLPDYLEPTDLVVVNNTRVFRARLVGHRVPSGGRVECLLLGRIDEHLREALVHPGQKLREGARVRFEGHGDVLHGEIEERRFFGRRLIRLWTESGAEVDSLVDQIGHVPLPPYIKRPDTVEDRERYQTIFATERGSVAAPTAGLHFTPALLDALAGRGVQVVEITLHVGYGTFKPVRVGEVEQHVVDPEPFTIAEPAARAVNRALDEGRRVVAVGTTTTRALEASAHLTGRVDAGSALADLFIYPGFTFRVVGGLVTNFHLPRSSLLMLAAAFVGRESLLGAYRTAVAERYRFYSYGDAMLIL